MENSSYHWQPDELAGLRDAFQTMERHKAELGNGSGPSENSARLNAALQRGLEDGRLDDFLDETAAAIRRGLDDGTTFLDLVRSLTGAGGRVKDFIVDDYADDLPRAIRAMRAFSQLRDMLIIQSGQAYADQQVARLEDEQRHVIRELSTPVIEVWPEILIMPLIGAVDSGRAKQMMEQLLTRIVETESRFVIIDVTGVPTVDTEVANHFLRTTQAARLLGAQSILVGITPQVAQVLVRIGIPFGEVETHANLGAGLRHALRLLGYKVERTNA